MGTWGTGSFENDSAQEFMQEVVQDGEYALREAFEVVLDPDMDYVEAEEGARAIAAAEVLASVLTGETSRISDAALRHWVQTYALRDDLELTRLAARALGRILAPDSELPELWEEAGEAGAWLADVQRLRQNLG